MKPRVKFLNEELHKAEPDFYPEVGTIGIMEGSDIYDKTCLVRWPEGTVDNDPDGEPVWYCDVENIEIVKEDNNEAE